MDVEDCVVEVCVGIGPGPCAQQLIPASATQESDVLYYVGYTLLILLLIHAPYIQNHVNFFCRDCFCDQVIPVIASELLSCQKRVRSVSSKDTVYFKAGVLCHAA